MHMLERVLSALAEFLVLSATQQYVYYFTKAELCDRCCLFVCLSFLSVSLPLMWAKQLTNAFTTSIKHGRGIGKGWPSWSD